MPNTIFENLDSAVDILRRDRLVLAASSLGLDITGIDNSYLQGKLLTAEAKAQRELRVFFAPTVMLPEEATQDEIDALELAGTRYAQEPAYDYDPGFFHGESWGFIQTRQKPLISVQSIKLRYPMPTMSVFDVPNDWLRLDRKYGHIRLVPGAMQFSAPLAVFVMPALGGGRFVPNMIQVRYTAGLRNAAAEYPDLIDLIYKMAAVSIIEDAMMPASGSISADGLSQSISNDVSKYQDVIDRLLNGPPGSNGGLRTAIHGITLGFIGGA